MTHVLIDGPNIAMRGIMATMQTNLKAGGRFTGGVLASTTSLANTLNRLHLRFGRIQPIIAFDGGYPERRKNLIPDYKQGDRAARKLLLTDEQLKSCMSQVDTCMSLWQTFGVPCVRIPNYEADDLVYWMSRRTPGKTIVLSNDKDLLQCVGRKGVSVWNDSGQLVNRKALRRKFGVDRRFFVLFRGLVGDKSDNVDGLMGCGEKYAAELINAHQPDIDAKPVKQLRQLVESIEAVLAAGDDLKKYELELLNDHDRLKDVLRGIDLACNPEPPFEVDNLSIPAFEWKTVRKALKRLSFKSFLTDRASTTHVFAALPKNPDPWGFLRLTTKTT